MITVPSRFKVVNLIWDLHMMCYIVMVFILSISILIFCYSNLQWKCTRRFCAGCHISSWPIRSLQTIKEFTVWHQQRRLSCTALTVSKKLSRNFSEAPFSVIWKAIYERTKDKNTQKSSACIKAYDFALWGVWPLWGVFQPVSASRLHFTWLTSLNWITWPCLWIWSLDSKRKANAEPNLKALK